MRRGQRSLLLVDDSTDTLEMYALGLKHAGYRVLTATNAAGALVQLNGERPHAVVTDVQLVGGRSGWDLIDEMKRRSATRDIPVIVLTGGVDPSMEVAAARAGCAAVLTKPCLPDELARVLEQLVPAI
jgi:CheY-like chemotaxis protein